MMLIRELTDSAQLAEIDELSQQGPIVVFKHSTRCPISAMAWNRLQSAWDRDLNDLPVYFLDLIAHRATSDAVSVHYGIQHESPQLLYIEDSKVVYQTSHNGINVNDIKEKFNA